MRKEASDWRDAYLDADGGVLEDVGAGIGEAGDDIIDGAADAVDRLADDGIDSENTGNTDTGVQ